MLGINIYFIWAINSYFKNQESILLQQLLTCSSGISIHTQLVVTILIANGKRPKNTNLDIVQEKRHKAIFRKHQNIFGKLQVKRISTSDVKLINEINHFFGLFKVIKNEERIFLLIETLKICIVQDKRVKTICICTRETNFFVFFYNF